MVQLFILTPSSFLTASCLSQGSMHTNLDHEAIKSAYFSTYVNFLAWKHFAFPTALLA